MQALAKVDYQSGTKHAFFGRYLVTRFTQEPGYAGGSDSLLKTSAKGADMSSHSTTFGATTVFSCVDRQRPAVRVQQGHGGRVPDAVLPAEAISGSSSTPTCPGT